MQSDKCQIVSCGRGQKLTYWGGKDLKERFKRKSTLLQYFSLSDHEAVVANFSFSRPQQIPWQDHLVDDYLL